MTKLKSERVGKTYRITDDNDLTVALVYIRHENDLPPAEIVAETLVAAFNDPALWYFLAHVQRGIADDVTETTGGRYFASLVKWMGEIASSYSGEATIGPEVFIFKLAHTAINWLYYAVQKRTEANQHG